MLIVEGRHTHGEPPDGCPQRGPRDMGAHRLRRRIGGNRGEANEDMIEGRRQAGASGAMKRPREAESRTSRRGKLTRGAPARC